MEALGYQYLLGDPWLPYSIGLAVFCVVISIVAVRRLPARPWLAFALSCGAAYLAAFVASGLKGGFLGGAEAVVWNGFGAVLFTPVWLPVCMVVHIVMRRDLIRRR